MFRALRHRPFRLLWIAVILGQLGYWVSSVAFQWEVASRTGHDALALGFLYFCSFTPYLILSLPAGMLADSLDRGRLLVAAQVAAAAIAVTATLLSALALMPIWAVMALSFLAGCVITVVSPTSHALIATVVPPEDLPNAVPLQSAGLNMARIAAPALVGPLLLVSGPTSALGGYVALSLAAWAVAERLRARMPPAPARAARRETIRRQLAAGLTHVRERPPALAALGVVAATSVFGSAYQAQLPLLAARVADGGEAAFSTLATLTGVGAMVGGLLVAWRGARRGTHPRLRAPAAQLVLLGSIVAMLGVVPWFPLLAALMVLGGGLILSIMSSINTILQHLIDDAQRGRVLSLYFVCWGGLLPFGGLGLGGMVELLGAEWAFGGYGAVAVLCGLAVGCAPAGRVHGGRRQARRG